MQKLLWILAAGLPLLAFGAAVAQPPGGGRGGDRGGDRPAQQGDLVTRMMAFDKNKDGKLTKDEITDPPLMRLFEQADTNKDGVVTKEELEALAKKLATDGRGGQGPGGGPGGPGGQGGRGRGPGGPGGMGGRGGFGPPQPGAILPPFMQDQLKLTEEQKKQLEALQKEVTDKIDKILTDEQKKQMKEMGNRGPGGPGGGPGRGPGGPGGGPGGPDR